MTRRRPEQSPPAKPAQPGWARRLPAALRRARRRARETPAPHADLAGIAVAAPALLALVLAAPRYALAWIAICCGLAGIVAWRVRRHRR